MSPSSPASISSRIMFTGGLYRNVWPGISTRPALAARRDQVSASSTEAASGFSTKTCLPASSAAEASA